MQRERGGARGRERKGEEIKHEEIEKGRGY